MSVNAERPPIRFLFDYISPYAYLAWTQIHALAARHEREVEPVPVLFAAMLNAHGNKGPAEIPPKRVYIFKDAVRLAHALGVQLSPPPTHPFNPLPALRISSLPMSESSRRELIDRLFRAAWGGAGGVGNPADVAAIASEAGLDGSRLLADADAPQAKAFLRRRTEEAIAAGAFGVPTLLVDGELFWGVDSLPHIDAFLRGADPVTPELLDRWSHIQPSASRIK
jgi:2-hydroxychromene-2-carboxylate isomerase